MPSPDNRVLQSGTVTPGHAVIWVTDGVVADGTPNTSIITTPNVPTQPIGQGGMTVYAGVDYDVHSTHPAAHEFGFSVNFTNSLGAGGSVPLSWNRVAGYFAIQTGPGGGNAWAINPLLLITSGGGSVGGQQIAEFDMANNSGTHFGDAPGFAGVVQPAVFGEQMTGISTNRVTAAYVILGNTPGPAPMWNRGIVAGPATIRQAFLEDYSSATRSYCIQGAHVYGIDTVGPLAAPNTTPATFSAAAIRINSQDKVVARNAANSADLTLLQTDGADNFRIGQAGMQTVLLGLQASSSYANDAAAATGGVEVGGLYRNGSAVMIRIT